MSINSAALFLSCTFVILWLPFRFFVKIWCIFYILCLCWSLGFGRQDCDVVMCEHSGAAVEELHSVGEEQSTANWRHDANNQEGWETAFCFDSHNCDFFNWAHSAINISNEVAYALFLSVEYCNISHRPLLSIQFCFMLPLPHLFWVYLKLGLHWIPYPPQAGFGTGYESRFMQMYQAH